jgi:hypothetical protein
MKELEADKAVLIQAITAPYNSHLYEDTHI